MTKHGVLTIKGDEGGAVIAILAFCCTSLLTIIPILRHTYLPLVDLPNHIARHYLATAPAGILDKYYEYTFSLVPNSAIDLAWIMFGRGMDPVDFTRYSMAAYCVALIASTMLLARVLHGRWSVWSAAVALVCYNASFFWGFQNFIVSVPFAILGLTAWLWTERLTITRRLLLLTPIVFVLYLLHFFAFAILAIIAIGRELQRIFEAGTGWKRPFWQACLLAIPFAVPIAWLAFDLLTGPESAQGSRTAFGAPLRRLEAMQSVILGVGLDLPTGIRLTGLAVFVMLLFIVCAALSNRFLGGLKVARQMHGPLLTLCVFTLLMPFWLNGVAWVHIRFPFVVFALFFAATQWRDLSRQRAAFIAVIVFTLVAGRSVTFDRFAAMHSSQVEDFIELTEVLPAGERLIVTTVGREAADRRFWHLGAYAVTTANVFIPTLFQGVHALRVKQEWAEFATPAFSEVPMSVLLRDWGPDPINPQLEFMRNWNEKYTYLVLLGSPNETFAGIAELDEIAARGRFTLFKVVVPQKLQD